MGPRNAELLLRKCAAKDKEGGHSLCKISAFSHHDVMNAIIRSVSQYRDDDKDKLHPMIVQKG